MGSTVDALPEPEPGSTYLVPISAALTKGDYERAEDMLRTRLNDVPDDAIAWEVLGVALALQGDIQGADDAYARAVEIDQMRLTAWVKRGDLAEASGDIERAIELWQSAAELQPSYGPANARLGRTLAERGEPSQALVYLEAAVAVEDSDALGSKPDLALIYNQLGRAAQALKLLEPWDAPDSDAVPEALLALGNSHAQMGDADAALARYARGLEAAPQDTAIARAMGALLVEMGDAERAADVLTVAAAAEPANAFANLTYARALAAVGRYPEAVAAAERAVEATSTPDLLRQSLSMAARANLFVRDFTVATTHSERLVAEFPQAVDAWREHAAIVAATGQYDAAKAVYDDALVRFSTDAQLLRGRSVVNVRLDDLEAAYDDAARAAEAAPTWFEPHFLVGEIAQARGLTKEADAAFRRVLDINPNHWPSVVYLARSAQAKGDLSKAQELAKRAVTLSGGTEPVQALLDDIDRQLSE
ncbi:MAG: tetratricopeptide repeat protein [Roseobacter sp.]